MKATQLFRFGLYLMATLMASGLRAEPLLNGLAVSTEFNKERFIAALYADTLTEDANQLLNSGGHRRMELKVTADSLSARSVNGMWVEGMAINNPSSALEAQAENLAKLNNMVRKRLKAGDVLAFDAEPGNGVVVTLNDVQLGTINSEDFFPMLLRTWIGSIPLSSSFKDSLLAEGDVDRELADRYADIEPADARVEAVAGWSTPAPPQPQVVDATSIAPPRPDASVSSPPPGGDSSEDDDQGAEAPETAPETAPEAQDAESSVAAAETQEQTEPEQTPETQASQPETQASQPESEPAEAGQVARAEPAPPAEAPEGGDEEEAEEAMVTAESLLLRQRYISDVMQKTYSSMRYPRRALQRAQEGSIRLAVTVNRDGELQEVEIMDESRYSLLNREATASLERASPFPELPEGMAGETFSFGIPVTFRLQ